MSDIPDRPKRDYDRLLELAGAECVKRTGHSSLSRDVASHLLLLDLSGSTPDQNPEQLVKLRFPEAWDRMFEELKSGCLSYCEARVASRETAEDIAQEAIMSLLQSRTHIHEPRAWLTRVCHNLLVRHYQERSSDSKMLTRLKSEALVSAQASPTQASVVGDDPELDQIPALVATKEYKDYQELKAYKKLGDYATAKGISLNQAKQLSKQLKKDLRAMYLRHLGWKNTPDILDYNQYKAIQRYIRQLVACVGIKGPRQSRKNSFLPSGELLDKCFAYLVTTMNWNVCLKDEDTYEVVLECLNSQGIPAVIETVIRIKPNHRIETVSCRRLDPQFSFDVGDKVKLPTEKGVCTLSLEELLEFLAEKETLNKQRKQARQKVIESAEPDPETD